MVSITGSDIWKRIEAGQERAFQSLRVIPLVGPSRDEPAYRLFGDDTAGQVEITEVGEQGSVPNIKVHNTLNDRILLIDGQELIGAKQNRILNTDVLVAAGSDVVIPVSCVERGRWGYMGRGFRAGKMAYRSVRASKSSQVHRALAQKRGHQSAQGDVWHDVDEMMCRLGSSSATAAMHEAYEQRSKDLDEIRAALEMPEQTVGVAVYHGDRFLGLDLFDRAATFAHYWRSLIDSYALDWLALLESAGDETPAETSALALDQVVQTLTENTWERYDAPGEGSDVRCEDDTLTASALVWGDGDDVLHLQAFPKPEDRPRSRLQDLERSVESVEAEVGAWARLLRAFRTFRRRKTET